MITATQSLEVFAELRRHRMVRPREHSSFSCVDGQGQIDLPNRYACPAGSLRLRVTAIAD
jgi:hypothetical protein